MSTTDIGRGNVRLLFVQYAGNFHEAATLLENAGEETYYGHAYVLGVLASLADSEAIEAVGVLSCLSGDVGRYQLPSGVAIINENADPDRDFRRVGYAIREFAPTHVIVLAPMPKVIRLGVRLKARILCLFADSFNSGRVRRFLRYGRLASLLNAKEVEWIGNHGVNSCRSLARIGVERAKIVPWDWPHSKGPDLVESRTLPTEPLSILYVGKVSKLKGVGDLIQALATPSLKKLDLSVDIVGDGDVVRYQALAESCGIAGRVTFVGRIPNREVRTRMRAATVVVVPSRHRFPEGFPLTIYEALSVRTPVVASDHPMFEGVLRDGETAAVFRAGDPGDLANAILGVLSSRELYSRLSENSVAAWDRLRVDATWGDLVTLWLKGADSELSGLRRKAA